MKRTSLSFITILMVMFMGSCLFLSCDDDKKEEKNEYILNGTYKLDYYYWETNSNNKKNCTWGEYMMFNNGALVWNDRQGGENSAYTYTEKNQKIRCINVLDNNDIEELTYTLSSSTLILRNEKNKLVRHLTKKY